MSNEKILKEIDELIMKNRLYRQYYTVTTEEFCELLNTTNGLLGKIKTIINSEKKDYNKGLNDAWELARKIVSLSPQEGGYSCHDMLRIFGHSTLREISDQYTVQEALEKVEEYNKKKAEEEAKLVPGDVVEIKNMSYGDRKAIFIKYEDDDVVVLSRKGGSTRLVGKDVWTIVKTGKHVDISELIEVLYD